MKILVDTCVLTELRHPRGNPAVRHMLEPFNDEDLYLSVVTLGLIARSIGMIHTAKRPALSEWLVTLEQHFPDRILPIDLDTAQLWGTLSARAHGQGFKLSNSEGLMAATAMRHGLHLMTRRTRAYAATGVPLIDPWNPRG